MLELPPLSLYVHVPWCERKCPYCDFNSHQLTAEPPEQAYVDALCADWDSQIDNIKGRPLRSIFIGGGTPSLLSAAAYGRLLKHLQRECEFAEDIEITLEANPGSAEVGRFRGYRDSGINRLSLGIQSFDDLQLQKLGRIHDSGQARLAIEMARVAGYENFNIDLMHSLPGQTTAAALADLASALDFAPPHLSWYQLTIEPNTVFYSRPPPLPDDDDIEETEAEGQRLLAGRGYRRYEVSAYARPGQESRHNLNYWRFGDYLGIGAGAHGKLSDPESGSVLRSRKAKQPDAYLGEPARTFRAPIDREHLASEYVLNALRLRAGFSRSAFAACTGLSFETIAKQVEYLSSRDLLVCNGDRVATTERGYALLNTVLEEFI